MKRTYGKVKEKVKTKLKRGDSVIVLSGREKGKTGKILFVEMDRVVVEKLNIVKKTKRPDKENPKGGIMEIEASMHISNVMYIDPKSGTGTRLGYRFENDEKVRFAKKSQKTI
jgi:large subunit ribosomal protein L24